MQKLENYWMFLLQYFNKKKLETIEKLLTLQLLQEESRTPTEMQSDSTRLSDFRF